MSEPYLPREDSFLLAEQVKKYAKGNCLDLGTGSGILALAAAKKANKVVATDIDKKALEFCKKNIKNKKISFVQSDLFNKIKGKFDTIIFNPPYLPAVKREPKELARKISGGKKGYELLEKFLNQVNEYLKPNGKILIVFSSLTNKARIDQIIKENLLESKLLSTKRLFFETLYVYLIQKSKILKELNKKLNNIHFLAKGHRGLIFTANYKNKKVIIKLQRKDIAAKGTVKRESKFLKLLNKHNIGPKLLFAKNDYFVAEYVKGKLIRDFLKTATKEQIKKVLTAVFNQCYTLDKLKINKEEMHHPYKHIIVNKKPVLIDFERANYTKKPKNVTQFCQYILKMLAIKNKRKLINLAQQYKKSLTKQNLNKIIAEITKTRLIASFWN